MHSKTIIDIANSGVEPHSKHLYTYGIGYLLILDIQYVCFSSIAPTAWGKLHTSSNLSKITFQSSSDAGVFKKDLSLFQ